MGLSLSSDEPGVRNEECDKWSPMNGHSRGQAVVTVRRSTMGEENLINYQGQYQDRESLIAEEG